MGAGVCGKEGPLRRAGTDQTLDQRAVLPMG